MEKRAAVRFASELEAECRSCGQSWTSLLCNISSTGCMIVAPDAGLPDGALVRLRLKGLTAIDGATVWQNRGHLGIRFLEPLHPTMMGYLGAHGAEAPPACLAPREVPTSRRGRGGLHGELVKRIGDRAGPGRTAANG